MKKLMIFLLAYSISLFIFSNYQAIVKYVSKAQTQETKESWFIYLIQNETDWDGDGNPDLKTSITPYNETFLEINVQVQNTNLEFNFTVCNVSGVKWVQVWVNITSAKTPVCIKLCGHRCPCEWTYIGNFTVEEDCYDFSFSQDIQEANVRVNFNQGYKYIQLRTGKGSEIKEAMPSKYFYEEKQRHDSLIDYLSKNMVYVNDWNMSILLKNGTAIVNHTIRIVDKNATKVGNFHFIAWHFSCFNFTPFDDYNTSVCPNDASNISEIFRKFAEKEIKLRERNASYTYGISFLLIDNKTGNLTFYKRWMVPSEEEMLEEAKKNLPSLLEKEVKRTHYINLIVDFGFEGTSHCVRFPIPIFSNATINITMPSKIANYSLGDLKFVKYVRVENNSLIAGIFQDEGSLQVGEVCSE